MRDGMFAKVTVGSREDGGWLNVVKVVVMKEVGRWTKQDLPSCSRASFWRFRARLPRRVLNDQRISETPARTCVMCMDQCGQCICSMLSSIHVTSSVLVFKGLLGDG